LSSRARGTRAWRSIWIAAVAKTPSQRQTGVNGFKLMHRGLMPTIRSVPVVPLILSNPRVDFAGWRIVTASRNATFGYQIGKEDSLDPHRLDRARSHRSTGVVIPTSFDVWTVIARSGATKQSSWIAQARFAHLVMAIVYTIRTIGINPQQAPVQKASPNSFRLHPLRFGERMKGKCQRLCHTSLEVLPMLRPSVLTLRPRGGVRA